MIFVSGASGFIGCRLVYALASQGYTVRALCRRGDLPKPPGLPLGHEACGNRIRIVNGDITDRDSLARGMEGCTQVYHLAGYAKNWAADPKTYYDINVAGVENILAAARDVGVERTVWTSTMMTFGPTRRSEVADESRPRIQPPLTEYERSKIVAEERAQRRAADGQHVVIVNPTRVFGPGHLTEGNSLSMLIDQYDRGRAPFLLNNGRNVANYVFVDDLVAGLQLAMQRGRSGERYILGGENISLKEFFKTIDRISGRQHFTWTVRLPMAMTFAWFQKLRAEWLGAYPQITPPWVRVFLADWAFSIAKAEQELGYRPRPLEEGLRITYAWLQQLHLGHAA